MKRVVFTMCLLVAASSVRGATCTWTGSWSEDPNSADDQVVIQSGSDLTWDNSLPATIASWTQELSYSNTVTFEIKYGAGFTNLTITGDCVVSNGTWKHLNNSSSEANRLHISVGGDFTLGPNAEINLNTLGYYRAGPGCPLVSNGGAAHGGRGGKGQQGSEVTYGNLVSPTNIGSGGANGGSGGGAVYLTVGSEVRIDGVVSADGSSGSGGSIFIAADTFTGNGAVHADGGLSAAGKESGGGRVSVILNSGNTFDNVTMTAYGSQHSLACHAAAGTIYTETAIGIRTLTVDNNNLYWGGEVTTAIPTGHTWDLDCIILGGKGILDIPADTTLNLNSNNIVNASTNIGYIRLNGGTFNLPSGAGSETVTFPSNTAFMVDASSSVTGDLVFAAGSLLTHSATVTPSARGTNIYTMDLNVYGDLTIHTGAQVNVDFLGYYRSGPGRSPYTAGGTHGGTEYGGRGASYGSIVAPVNSGSGGNNGNVGGGAIGLRVTGNALLGGNMTANGAGGTGGSVFLTTGTLTGGGDIAASGGDTSDGYNGGGGRVSVVLTNAGATFAAFEAAGGTVVAHGGERIGNTLHAAAGTVYSKDSVIEQVIIDNRDKEPNDDLTTCFIPPTFTGSVTYAAAKHVFDDDLSPVDFLVQHGGRLSVTTDVTFASLTVTNNSKFTISDAATIAVGSMTVNGTGFTPGFVYSVADINTAVGESVALGDGFVNVGIPFVSNREATNAAMTSANLNGHLDSVGGDAPEVSVYWATSDGVSNKNVWGNTNSFGLLSAAGPLTTNINLNPDTVYFYRYYATNAYAHDWAEETEILLTGEVWVQGTDTNAAESGPDPGTCTVFRAATATNGPIAVYYSVTGTAEEGVDFESLSGVVTILQGNASAPIEVMPIFDNSLDPETVVLTIMPGPYMIGSSNVVTVTIDPLMIPPGYNAWVGSDPSSTSSWSEGHVPTESDHILLSGYSLSNLTWNSSMPTSVASWSQDTYYDGTVTIDTKYPGQGSFTNFAVVGDLTINGGTWTHALNPTGSTEEDRLKVTVGGNLILGSNAVITANSLGFYRTGPGSGIYGRGGSHGGTEDDGAGYTYGSIVAPYNLGSGGNNGWRGGGAIDLTVASNAMVGGSISANGWGGAGGSILLTASTLTGGGNVEASGGWSGGNYYGGGGRVAVVLTGLGATFEAFDEAGGTNAAYGGFRTDSPTTPSAAGTVYRKGSAGEEVIIDNGGKTPNDGETTCHVAGEFTGNGTYTAGEFVFEDYLKQVAVVVRNGGHMTINSNVLASTLLVESTARGIDLGDAEDMLLLKSMTIEGETYSLPGDYTVANWRGGATPSNVTGDGTIVIMAQGTVLVLR